MEVLLDKEEDLAGAAARVDIVQRLADRKPDSDQPEERSLDRFYIECLFPAKVSDFMKCYEEGDDITEVSENLYKCICRNAVVIEDIIHLLEDSFLERVGLVIQDTSDEVTYHLIRFVGCLWKKSGTEFPELFTQLLFESVRSHMDSSEPQLRREAIVSLTAFAGTDKSYAYALLESDVCDVLCEYLASKEEEFREIRREVMSLIHVLLSNMDEEDYHSLNPLIQFYLPFIANKNETLRVLSTKCLVLTIDSPPVFECMMENQLIENLLWAQHKNFTRQAGDLYFLFKKVIDIVGPDAIAKGVFFKKFYDIMHEDKDEIMNDTGIYPHICDVICVMMPTHSIEFFKASVIELLVKWAVDGTCEMRIVTAKAVASFLTYGDIEQVDIALSNGAFDAVVDVITEAHDEELTIMVQCIDRLLREERIDESILEVVENLDEEDMTEECHSLWQEIMSHANEEM